MKQELFLMVVDFWSAEVMARGGNAEELKRVGITVFPARSMTKWRDCTKSAHFAGLRHATGGSEWFAASRLWEKPAKLWSFCWSDY